MWLGLGSVDALKVAQHFFSELFTKANNLLNEDIRDATSYIKDIAPQGGRSIMFGLRGDF